MLADEKLGMEAVWLVVSGQWPYEGGLSSSIVNGDDDEIQQSPQCLFFVTMLK